MERIRRGLEKFGGSEKDIKINRRGAVIELGKMMDCDDIAWIASEDGNLFIYLFLL